MKYLIICIAALLLSLAADAGVLTGRVVDEHGQPLGGVSVAVLHPEDSTMATFGITAKTGLFQINDAKEGSYLLQVAMTGYYTEYRVLKVVGGTPLQMGDISLKDNLAARQLGEVVVSGEKVPVRIKGDTVEYNSGSYKVKPNAPVEDLLRQLPGVQVDQEGNVKAMGKDVKKVLVDGKEFFGNDPKVATKNLPADAVSRVQTFGKKSDQSEFTGVDDGQRDQTINLVLKDGKRKGYFGNLEAGGGTEGRYQGSARVFQFRPKTQLAAIGMLNNINQSGFSFNDYLNFNGGLAGLMSGGGGRISLSSDDDLPVNFGQPVTGDITSGALGLNYSFEPRPKNRFNVSYLGNGSRKQLDNENYVQNFLPDGSRYNSDEQEEQQSSSIAHRLSAKWRNEIDSLNQIVVNLRGQLKDNNGTATSNQLTYTEAALQNRLADRTTSDGHTVDASGDISYVKKMHSRWRLFELTGSGGYSRGISNTEWQNVTHYYQPNTDVSNSQYQQNNNAKILGSLAASLTRSLGHALYLEPELKGGYRKEILNRDQGLLPDVDGSIDSLSPHFYNNIYTVTPGISLRKSLKDNQWNISLQGHSVTMNPVTKGRAEDTRHYEYLLPSLSWRKDLDNHKTLSVEYGTAVNTPATNQLLPVTYYTSALSGITGNLDLKPEYAHNLHINFNQFDQFNMSSFFAYLNGSYTVNKINTARTVNPDLSQHLLWVNTPYEGRAGMQAEYSRPVRKLGIEVGGTVAENVSMSVSPVNNVDNKNTTWTHELSLKISNRNRDKWNLRGGGTIRISDSRYSLNKELNATYYNYTGYGYISYQPTKKWFFQVTADISHYTGNSFAGSVTIPLLKAEATRFLLKNERASVTLRGFDLLDQNKSVQRVSQMNYLLEQRSNIISRYFMLVLSYKLNKVGHGGEVITVQ